MQTGARIGAIIPANNSVIEPELWSRLPEGAAMFSTRVMARGDLTPDAVRAMTGQVQRAADELASTEVDIVFFADMVTTFIMDEHWNEREAELLAARTGAVATTAWLSMRAAMEVLGIRSFALGTPYPSAVHKLACDWFERAGYELTDNATLDILAMREVPRVTTEAVIALAQGLKADNADAILLLATDLPTFAAIARIEEITGKPVVTNNQALLWDCLRRLGISTKDIALGQLFRIP